MEDDGRATTKYVHDFFNNTLYSITDKHLALIGENDETLPILGWDLVIQDLQVRNDPGSIPLHGRPYMAIRRHSMRLRYRAPLLTEVDAMNTLAGKPLLEYYWYDNRGADSVYVHGRTICRFNDGRRRPGPYTYPQYPLFWRHSQNDRLGIDAISDSRQYELASNDVIFIPSVCPGWSEGNKFVPDAEMLRPGQFLGILKGLNMMGAESFSLFDYNASALTRHDANWRTWKPTIPAYAQAIQGRLKEFLYTGEALIGDRSSLYHGAGATFLNFSTGNDQDFVTGRKMNGQERYVIAASAQRLSNAPSQAPHNKIISFRLRNNQNNVIYNPMVIEERLQGSTYYLDNTNPASPIFYQLDKWHEWKEPSHWCRDFDFEAEVWDSLVTPGVATIHTDLRPGATAGDFVGFTSYVTLASTNDRLRYYFRPRGADQSTMYVWIRVRNNTGSPQNLTVNVDGLNQKLMPVPFVANAWQWIGIDDLGNSVMYTPLNTSQHYLEMGVENTGLEIDQVTLKRSSANFSTQTFTVAATTTSPANSVCLGSPFTFNGAVTQPSGCIDYLWDFGDGGRAYDLNTTHTYQYPGDYTVTFSATHQCLETTRTTTIIVHVNAPYVEAGPDQLVCAGGNDHFQPVLFAATNPRWSVRNPLMNIATVTPATGPGAINPLVVPTISGYYYFTADSNSTLSPSKKRDANSFPTYPKTVGLER